MIDENPHEDDETTRHSVKPKHLWLNARWEIKTYRALNLMMSGWVGDDVGENDLSWCNADAKQTGRRPLIIVLTTIQRLQHKSRVYYTTTFLKELLLVFTQ
jgi:hypothetical protein